MTDIMRDYAAKLYTIYFSVIMHHNHLVKYRTKERLLGIKSVVSEIVNLRLLSIIKSR